ncbi:MAG: nicotinate-nucleotide--dimethylbenzimidazole phosphoribosyltransferase [Alphaproteobacteria bacterium]|nr:nicotinate-nucleotide--dimethylbenzimidazole phosphoribosyltransferase [Alphaproteobacteria bacterium]
MSSASFDETAAAEAQAAMDGLAKPPGSLGRLESLAVWLAGVQGRAKPRVDNPRVIVFAGDHGVARDEAVSPYPPEVTATMVRTFAEGRAAVAVLARQAGAALEVVDVGVRGLDQPVEGVVRARVAPGTLNLARGPAMTPGQRDAAIAAGRRAALRAAADGVDLLALGEMGIGNTTPASALTARLLGVPASMVVGPGTGLDAEGVRHKATVVQRALDRNGPRDPMGALADLGGFEIAALVGCMLEASSQRIPILLDGFIVGAAALVAVRHRPELARALMPATASAEPGHRAVIEALGTPAPLLDWGLRLGEASGAALLIPACRSASALLHEMATLAEVLAG